MLHTWFGKSRHKTFRRALAMRAILWAAHSSHVPQWLLKRGRATQLQLDAALSLWRSCSCNASAPREQRLKSFFVVIGYFIVIV